MRVRIFLLFLAAVVVSACGKPKEWTERYKRSARADIDLYLVPEKYALLESSWLKKTAIARFDKQQLVESLAQYGRSIDDLRRNPAYEYKEQGNLVNLRVGRISHSTAYDYDVNIPLVFHGKWFDAGQFGETVYQQHIAPTLAKLLGVTAPSGVEVTPLSVRTDIQAKPEIVVVAVIDQGGTNLLTTHRSAAPRIHALMQKSANYTGAQVGHLDAHTAVGHMAIGTGAFPVKSTVIGNTFFSMERKDGKEKLQKSEIYATKDESKVSPEELKSESLADVLNVVNKGRSVIISQSYALRAALGMAGHGSSLSAPDIAAAVRSGNHVYWLDAGKSRWITDTRYYSLPGVAKASEPLLHFMKYYPQGYQGYQIRDSKAAFENWGVMMATPAETQLEGELVRAAISQEIIGKKRDKDGFTDLVYVTFKSADAVGHHFGYHSLEARETLAEIDAQIGKIEDFLRQNYGENFALVLTADHGCAPLSEITGGARLTVEEVITEIDKLLPPAVAANESLVTFMTVGQVSLNKKLMAAHNITLEQVRSRIKTIKPEGKLFFKDVLTRADLDLGG
ncbi:MAG: alkaline phosphatase family protein [Spirochaetota bacterium]